MDDLVFPFQTTVALISMLRNVDKERNVTHTLSQTTVYRNTKKDLFTSSSSTAFCNFFCSKIIYFSAKRLLTGEWHFNRCNSSLCQCTYKPLYSEAYMVSQFLFILKPFITATIFLQIKQSAVCLNSAKKYTRAHFCLKKYLAFPVPLSFSYLTEW